MSTELKESSIDLAEKIVFRLSKNNAAVAAGVIGKSYIVAQIIEDHQDPLRDSLTKLVEEWREEARKLVEEDWESEIEGTLLNCADQLQALIEK